ncbi:S-adenosyl-L-methionine-dependent methyltransferase [Hyaloscypha finlandica]|nr:S-adenosyl-L-methionine-dependent methyltransferase [Hyaloscypha finlandica]
MSTPSVVELAKSINAIAENGTADVSEVDRQQLLQACSKLQSAFESPFEFTLRVIFSGHQAMALRLGVDLKLFDAAARKNGDEISIEELSEATKADPLLVKRIMGFLGAMGIFKEVTKGLYASTPLAASYVSSSPFSAVVIHVTHFIMVISKLPEYFEKKGWKNPDDVYNGPFQYAMGTDRHYFDFLASKPYYQQAFNTVMTLSHRRRGQNWFDFFPVGDKLRVQNPTDVALVDVGGSQGADLIAFKEKHPDMPGRLILQDLPIVIAEAKNIPEGIEAHGYDFFNEQPVKGAKAYYLRTVLHDWPDKQARQILTRVREAMAPDSILLINETMLPESNVALSSAQADLTMMVSFASLERTKEQFAALLNDSGFELVKVWMPEGFEESSARLAEQATLLEARLKQ